MIAVVPTIGLAPQLPALVDQLIEEGLDEVILTVNEPGSRLNLRSRHWKAGVHRVYVPGSIYAGWNLGIRRASRLGQTLAVLNDDAVPAAGALANAEWAMKTDPDVVVCGLNYRPGADVRGPLSYVSGTYQGGGIPGWAFLLDAKRAPLADEQFEWWYGDDDLVKQIEVNGGKVAIAAQSIVAHQGETSAVQRPWTHEAKIRDAERFRQKWGD